MFLDACIDLVRTIAIHVSTFTFKYLHAHLTFYTVACFIRKVHARQQMWLLLLLLLACFDTIYFIVVLVVVIVIVDICENKQSSSHGTKEILNLEPNLLSNCIVCWFLDASRTDVALENRFNALFFLVINIYSHQPPHQYICHEWESASFYVVWEIWEWDNNKIYIVME